MKFRSLTMHPSLVPFVLDGRKTMTRSPITLAGIEDAVSGHFYQSIGRAQFRRQDGRDSMPIPCPLGAVGDGLWLRERARLMKYDRSYDPPMALIEYDAYAAHRTVDWPARLKYVEPGHCIPNGVHREGARWHGEILEVRVERVQDISEADVWAEGLSGGVPEFGAVWTRLYGPGSWERNDWVWVVRWRALEAKP